MEVIALQYLKENNVNDILVIVREVLVVDVGVVTLTRACPIFTVLSLLLQQFLQDFAFWYDSVDQVIEAELRLHNKCRISWKDHAFVGLTSR